jgi:D-3-phosphoglycerate dehydrogenase
MTAWKILVTDGLEQAGLDILGSSAKVDDRNGISADELLRVAGDYDALVVRGRTKVNAAVIEAGKKLKVVGRAGVGVDNIDLNAARSHGVTVVNSPLATTTAVAELTLGMMLSLVREIARADATMKAGKWIKKELEGTELYGKTLGVIGFGRIGSAVSVRASAFGMNILAYDRFRKADDISARGGNPVSLEEMFARSDMISLHIPLTPETKNILNAEAFEKMKRGADCVCGPRRRDR